MKISRAIFRQEAVCHQQPQGCPFSKATATFAHVAYWQYGSTEQWRERRWRLFSTDPEMKYLVPEDQRNNLI